MPEALSMTETWSSEWLIAVAAIFGFAVGCLLVWAGGIAQRRHWAKTQADYESRIRDRQDRHEAAIRELAIAETKAAKVAAMEQDLHQARENLARLRAEQAASQAAMREREAALEKKINELTKLRGEMARDFETLAINVLKSSQSSFLALANETMQKHRSGAEMELQRRTEAIQGLIKPVEETLKRYESNLQALERTRQEAYGSLSAELKNVVATQSAVRAETNRLVNALRAAPKTRGRWGEHQLQNIMELSGMTEHVDFITQVSMQGEDGRLVPDAIIRLPGGRAVVVDAKTSMSAYLEALDAHEDAEKERLLSQHADQIRTHMKQLGSKKYWDALDVAPDFVAMFIPGDNFFAAAIERDPSLFEDAVANRVLLVTPTTMIALTKAIAYGWRQERMAENARQVADLGRELYRRLAKMGSHVLRTGKSLDVAVKSYNQLVGSLESSVMPQARRFNDLEIAASHESLPVLDPVEADVREPVKGRDLEMPGDQPAAKVVGKVTVNPQRSASTS